MTLVPQTKNEHNPVGWPAIVIEDEAVEIAIGHATWALGRDGATEFPGLFAGVLRSSIYGAAEAKSEGQPPCDCGGCVEVIARQAERRAHRLAVHSETHRFIANGDVDGLATAMRSDAIGVAERLAQRTRRQSSTSRRRS